MNYKQKKVLHIIVALNVGGAESTLKRLILNSHEFKHEVISLMDIGIIGQELQAGGIKVQCLGMTSVTLLPLMLIKLYKLILTSSPDIVQTWMYHADLLGGIAAKMAKVPRIYWGIRHSNLDKGTIKLSTYAVMKVCAKLSPVIPKTIISCSRQAITSHVKEGYVKDKFILLQNGYDLIKFKPYSADPEKINFDNKDKPIIGMVARFDVQKDHLNLIKALSLVKDKGIPFHLVLVGKGMDKENQTLTSYIDQSSLSLDDITLFGQSSNIPLLFNSIDLHVLSSLGEAFPNVLAEAMACGVPCVTTDVGDAKEIVANYGWVVPPQDASKLAEAILMALRELNSQPSDWLLRKQKGVGHIANNFELHAMVQKFHTAWTE